MALYLKKSYLMLILLIVLTRNQATLYPVIILTHGVLWLDKKAPHKKHWFESGGSFFNAIKQTADLLGHTTISYRWQQPLKGLTLSEHKKAAYGLCDLIKKCSFNTTTSEHDRKIIIIAHSMGGKVAALASNFLYNSHVPEERPQIEALFTLGTPHLKNDPQPNMHIINKLFNIVSENDKITNGPLSVITGAGNLPHPIASHDRATTLILEHEGLDTNSKIMTAPGHQALHSEIVGSNLLKIMALIDNPEHGFSKFSFLYNGRIRFFRNGIIEYEPVL